MSGASPLMSGASPLMSGASPLMESIYNKALSLGATDFGLSDTKTKRFYVIYNNRKINFGSKNGSTFIDHHNELLRKNWKRRHSKIIRSDGKPFYKIPSSPEFWAYNLLW